MFGFKRKNKPEKEVALESFIATDKNITWGGVKSMYLINAGKHKLDVIKIVMQSSRHGLGEAKSLVDNATKKAPSLIAENLPESEVMNYANQLRELGAIIEVK